MTAMCNFKEISTQTNFEKKRLTSTFNFWFYPDGSGQNPYFNKAL